MELLASRSRSPALACNAAAPRAVFKLAASACHKPRLKTEPWRAVSLPRSLLP